MVRLTVSTYNRQFNTVVRRKIPDLVVASCSLACEACASKRFDVQLTVKSSDRFKSWRFQIRLYCPPSANYDNLKLLVFIFIRVRIRNMIGKIRWSHDAACAYPRSTSPHSIIACCPLERIPGSVDKAPKSYDTSQNSFTRECMSTMTHSLPPNKACCCCSMTATFSFRVLRKRVCNMNVRDYYTIRSGIGFCRDYCARSQDLVFCVSQRTQ